MESRRPIMTTAPGYNPSRMPAWTASSTMVNDCAAAGAAEASTAAIVISPHPLHHRIRGAPPRAWPAEYSVRRSPPVFAAMLSADGELRNRAGGKPVERLYRAAVPLGEHAGSCGREHDVVGVGRVGQADGVAGFMDCDGEQGALGQRHAGVASNRK